MPAPAGAFSVFPHYRSSVCSRRSLLCISPCRSSVRSRRSLIRISPRPQQWLLPQERYLYFLTTAVVTAPLRSTICISPLPQQCLLPQERYLYFLTPAGAFSPPGPSPPPNPPLSLSQQPHATQEPPPAVFFTTAVVHCPLPQEPHPHFPTAAAVTAPAGALPVFPHYRSSDCSPQEHYLYFPTAAAVSAPARALSIFPRSSRSFFSSRPLPSPPRHPTPPLSLSQQPHATQEPPPAVFFTTAVVPALAGTFSIFPHYRSSACSSRNLLYISPLPQQWLLPQEHLPFSPLPQ